MRRIPEGVVHSWFFWRVKQSRSQQALLSFAFDAMDGAYNIVLSAQPKPRQIPSRQTATINIAN